MPRFTKADLVRYTLISLVLIATACIIHQGHRQSYAPAPSAAREKKLLEELEAVQKEIEERKRQRDRLPGSWRSFANPAEKAPPARPVSN